MEDLKSVKKSNELLLWFRYQNSFANCELMDVRQSVDALVVDLKELKDLQNELLWYITDWAWVFIASGVMCICTFALVACCARRELKENEQFIVKC